MASLLLSRAARSALPLTRCARAVTTTTQTPSFAATANQQSEFETSSDLSDQAFTLPLDLLRAPASGPIIPEFWTGQSPLNKTDYVIDCATFQQDLRGDTLPASLVEEGLAKYHDTGALLFTNTGLGDDLAAMRRLAVITMDDPMKYEGGANSRGEIVQNVFDTGAPASAHLHYHHEMAYVGESTKSLGFCCSHATDGKGTSFLSDNVKVTDGLLGSAFGQKLKEKGICYVRCLTDREEFGDDMHGVYNHWQQSFGVDTPEEAEALARSKGLEVEWGPGRYMRTKYYVSAFEYFPQLDRNLLYSSVADDGMWFDAWQGVSHLPDMEGFETATPAQKPLKLTFGDDTPMTRDELYQFVNVYDRFGFPIEWQSGDVAIFCNYRFAHGRPSYELGAGEQRQIGVVLGDMFDRVGSLDGKW
eukprot:m.73145 g.73145  ORF g.73145 m.73145 type:complete len:417 (+) comp14315_c0_seq3:284-1534(+)